MPLRPLLPLAHSFTSKDVTVTVHQGWGSAQGREDSEAGGRQRLWGVRFIPLTLWGLRGPSTKRARGPADWHRPPI